MPKLFSWIPADRRQFRLEFSKTWALAWPVILANISLPLLTLADAGILGHLNDPVYLAGVTAGASLMAFVFGGFNFLSMGISGFTSQSLGRKDYSEIITTLKRYISVAFVLIALVLIFYPLFVRGGIALIAPPAEVADQAKTYLNVRMFGVPAIILNIVLIGFFIGMQNTRITLYSVSVTQLVNIALNVLFVLGFNWQTFGIALGTVISEYLGLMLVLWHLKKALRKAPLARTPTKKLDFSWPNFRPIFHVSSHLFVRTFTLLLAFVWFNRIGASFGEVTLAANGILLAFFTVLSHFLDGTAAAAEAHTGHAIGEKNSKRLRYGWVASLILNSVFILSLMLLFAVFGASLLGLLTNQTEVFSQAAQHWHWIILLPLAGGFAFWADGVFIGARRSKDMRNSVLVGFALFIVLSFQFATTNNLLWASFCVFFVTRSTWLLTVFYKKLWSIKFSNSSLDYTSS